jgi:hypothetical protein
MTRRVMNGTTVGVEGRKKGGDELMGTTVFAVTVETERLYGFRTGVAVGVICQGWANSVGVDEDRGLSYLGASA